MIKMPEISVIIPCFNSGDFLIEAIESVKHPDKSLLEIIVVNDGSTDLLTLRLLNSMENKGYKIIHQENRGPAAARNTAIRHSKGEFLIFLDSDNKIKSEYIDKCLAILKVNSKVGVVYGNPSFIGEINRDLFKPTKFDLRKLLRQNYIDMCSVVRKRAWESVGGLDENRLLIGHEDWEFWINLASKGWDFFYLNEVLYEYRVRKNSLITKSTEAKNLQDKANYIFSKHGAVVRQSYLELYSRHLSYQRFVHHPIRSFFKYLYSKFIKRIN